MDILTWLADTGTNQWIKDFWANNWILVSIIGAPVGAILKDRAPAFWAKLSTILPFKGKV